MSGEYKHFDAGWVFQPIVTRQLIDPEGVLLAALKIRAIVKIGGATQNGSPTRVDSSFGSLLQVTLLTLSDIAVN